MLVHSLRRPYNDGLLFFAFDDIISLFDLHHLHALTLCLFDLPSHVGNRRFRDVITLHRPDYIRAIKMDKPGVARKIVKAIRLGNPPGR
jgi:hypothetical protein